MIEMDNIPFANKPVKAAYMWRDLERRAAMHGLVANFPVPYPLAEFDLANRVAMVGEAEGWCADYTQATYRRWFRDGLPSGGEPNLSDSLREIGQDPLSVVERANTPEVERAYRTATDEAKQAGVFGSPSFIVHGELFWGDDRLNDAISWYREGRVVAAPE